MPTRLYPGYRSNNIDFTSATVRAILVNASVSYDRTHQFVSSVVAGELTPSTRPTLASKTRTDNGSNAWVFDAADLTFPTITNALTANAIILYQFVTNDADSRLMVYVDGTNITTNGLDVVAQFNASGIWSEAY